MDYSSYVKEYTVTLNMLDEYDRLTPLAILDLFQDIAGKHCDGTSVSYRNMYDNGLLWIITRTRYDVVSNNLRYGDDVTVTTWANTFEKFSDYRHYLIKNKDGEVLVRGKFKWAGVSKETRKLSPLDDLVSHSDTFNDEQAIEDPLLVIPTNEEELDQEYKFTVLFTHLDHNGHMNNTRYVEELLKAVNFTHKEQVISLETNYLKEMNLGEEITIKYHVYPDSVTAIFKSEDEIKTRMKLKFSK